MDIEQKLEMFSPGKLSDLLVIYDHLAANGVLMEDLRTWLAERTSRMQKQIETEKEQIEKLIKKSINNHEKKLIHFIHFCISFWMQFI